MDKKFIQDIFEWDRFNWSKALPFWQVHLYGDQLKCLELGAHNGGPSLWLSSQGHQVLCTDLDSPIDKAKKLHDKYNANSITYNALDATNIPFENHFDIVVFKSVLGGISRDGKDEMKQVVVDQIFKALKPGGKLLFAENIEGSGLHRIARRKTRRWGSSWNYLKYSDKEELFSQFEKTEFKSVGFLSAFGPNEFFKATLGAIDTVLSPFISKSKKYILFGMVQKSD